MVVVSLGPAARTRRVCFSVDSALRHVGSPTCVCRIPLRTTNVMFVMRREMASADMFGL